MQDEVAWRRRASELLKPLASELLPSELRTSDLLASELLKPLEAHAQFENMKHATNFATILAKFQRSC
jgi:hypothetical protein